MNNEGITVKLTLERLNQLLEKEKALNQYENNAIIKCKIWSVYREYIFYKKESDGLEAANEIIQRLQKKIKAILNRSLLNRVFNSWNEEGEENISLY